MNHTFDRRFGLKVSAMLGAMAASGKLASVALAAPVGEPADIASATVGGELIIRAVELGDTMDPAKTGSAQVSIMLGLVGDSLVTKDYEGNIVPWIAESWEISEDGLVWTFKIREGVTFHDGTPLDANAVKFTFDRILDPETGAVTAAGLVGPMESTEALDDYTFQFTLGEPFAPILPFLDSSNLAIVSPTAVESMGDDFGRKPILSGPYTVEEWREGDRVILKRNPDYAWPPEFLHQDPAGAFIETITYQSIVEDASAVAAFEAGEIHQMGIPAADIARFEESDDFWITTYDRQGVVFLAFNVTKAPFDDVAVRTALMAAVNKQDVLDAALEGYGFPAHTYLSNQMYGYWDGMEDYAPAYDPDAAMAALEAAGWAQNSNGIFEKDGEKLEFEALNLPNDSYGLAAQVVQAQLADIGVTMNIQQMEFAAILERGKSGDFQSTFMGYSYSDPDVAYLLFDSSQAGVGINFNMLEDPEMDDLIARGRRELDRDARAEVYAEMERYINDQGFWIPLYYNTNFVGMSKSVANVAINTDNTFIYYDAFIKE